jgi:hypothetical protein
VQQVLQGVLGAPLQVLQTPVAAAAVATTDSNSGGHMVRQSSHTNSQLLVLSKWSHVLLCLL